MSKSRGSAQYNITDKSVVKGLKNPQPSKEDSYSSGIYLKRFIFYMTV